MKKINVNTKFIVLVTLVALMVLSLTIIVVANILNNDDSGVHTHTFGEWSSNEPTCTESAKQTRACTGCDTVEERMKAALGHDLVSHAAKNPTCEEDGYNAHKTCSRCNYSTKEVKSKLNHIIKDYEAREASCTEDGYDAYEACDRCTYTTKVIIPASHNFVQHICTECGVSECVRHEFGDWFGNTATCQGGGVEYRECSECRQKETRDTEQVSHKYENKVCVWCGKKDYTLPGQPLGKKKDD